MILNTKWSIVLLSFLMIGSTLVAQDDVEQLFRDAQTAIDSGDFAEAVELYRKLEAIDGDNKDVAFMLGYSLHASGKIDEAIKYHQMAANSDRHAVLGLYNLACAYSLKNEKDKAFKYLEKSIKAGYQQPDQIAHAKSDADFKNIQDDPRFDQMIAMMENGGKKPKAKLTKKDLLGSWKINQGMRAGAKIDPARLPTVKVSDKTFTIPAGEGQEFVMAYKVDMDAKPITVDFEIESGPVPSGKAKGIIKIEDGEMTLCYEPTGQERPEKFTSTEENNCFMFKLKREKKETKKEAAGIAGKLVGKWKCVKGVRAGEDVSDERMASTITIDEKLIVIPVGPDQSFEMSYAVDESKSPIAIDMKIEAGPAPEGSEAIGIIKVDGDTVTLCYDPNGANRPTAFESTAENGCFLFEMKPAK